MTYEPSKDWTQDWKIAEEHILDALDNSATEHNVFDVMSALWNGTAYLWVGERASAVTLLHDETYTLWLAGGDLAEIEKMWPFAEKHAHRLDAKKVVVFGRKGWARTFLRSHGFKHSKVVLEKVLR